MPLRILASVLLVAFQAGALTAQSHGNDAAPIVGLFRRYISLVGPHPDSALPILGSILSNDSVTRYDAAVVGMLARREGELLYGRLAAARHATLDSATRASLDARADSLTLAIRYSLLADDQQPTEETRGLLGDLFGSRADTYGIVGLRTDDPAYLGAARIDTEVSEGYQMQGPMRSQFLRPYSRRRLPWVRDTSTSTTAQSPA